MSESIAKKLRVGIIDKLKEYDCYIDNELPDYIMVMIANNKSSDHMKEDLSLFIGSQVGDFVDWLHHCLEELKAGKNPFQQRKDTPKKSSLSREVEQIVNNVSTVSNVESSNQSNNQSSSRIIKLNEDSKENTKDRQKSTTRKEITFNANEFEEQPKRNESKLISLNKTEQSKRSPQQSQHKRIIYNLDNNDQHKEPNSPSKKPRNQISYNQQTDLRSTLSSRLQHLNDGLRKSTHNTNVHNNSNKTPSINSFVNHNQTVEQMIVDKAPVQINQPTEPARQSSRPRNSGSIFGKAMADVNKSSTLEPIQRRQDSSKTSLIHRLGLSSKSAANPIEIEDKQVKKENRLMNTKLINDHLAKPSLERKRPIENSKPERKPEHKLERKLERKLESNLEPNLGQNQMENLQKDDLRLRLSSKRKKDETDDRQSIKRKVLNNQNKNDSDEELRILKDNIKPKTSLKPDKEANSEKKMDTDSDENVRVIIKRELLERIKTLEKTTANAQKIQQKSISKETTIQTIQSIKKERCYYWPVCNNQDKCQYHHPNAMCLQFPMCKFGQACLNIHPNCKFDMKCTKRDCPFTHVARKLVNHQKTKLPSTIQRITPVKKTI